MTDYILTHPDEIDIVAEIEWTKPYAYSVLRTGLAEEDCTANYYAIVGHTENDWWSYYIGMVIEQCVSARHRNQDHLDRVQSLKERYKGVEFNLSLGVLHLRPGTNSSRNLVEDIEGLLIYTNWHQDMINKKNVNPFKSNKTYQIHSKGFVEHLYAKEIVYGVVYKKT